MDPRQPQLFGHSAMDPRQFSLSFPGPRSHPPATPQFSRVRTPTKRVRMPDDGHYDMSLSHLSLGSTSPSRQPSSHVTPDRAASARNLSAADTVNRGGSGGIRLFGSPASPVIPRGILGGDDSTGEVSSLTPCPLNESNETMGTSSTSSCRHCSSLSQQWSDRGCGGESSLPLLHGNKFVIISTRGEGSFGIVYEVFHRTDNRYYAVKQLKRPALKKKEMMARFREVDVLTQVQSSPHVVRYYDSWVSDHKLHIQMELCQENLRRFMDSGFNSEERMLRVLAHISCALCTMHGLGFVHLDIKPENIYVHIDPCSRLPIFKLGDFGTARSMADTEDVDDGTNLYLAPEMLNPDSKQPYRQFDKADIFSLGVLVYEALRGVPMTSDCIASLRATGAVPRYAEKMSDEVFELLQQMMSLDPSLRPSARDIANMPLIQSLFISSPELLPSLEISRSSSAPRPDHSPIISELRQALHKSQCEAQEARTLHAEAIQLLDERERRALEDRAAALETQQALMRLLAR
jgi:hypothetical protein